MVATGAVEDPVTNLLKITELEYNRLHNLTFTIAGTDFVLTPNAQIWPVSYVCLNIQSTLPTHVDDGIFSAP